MDVNLDWGSGLRVELVDLDLIETADGLHALGSAVWRGPGVDVLVNLVLLPGSAVGADVVTVRTNGQSKYFVTGADLKAVPLGKIAAEAQTRALEIMQGGPDSDPGRSARVMEGIAAETIAVAQTLPTGRRKGRPPHDPAFLQLVAQVTLRMQAEVPPPPSLRRAVAEHFAEALGHYVSDTAVRDWWRAARKSYFLGPSPGPGSRTLTPGPRLNTKDPS